MLKFNGDEANKDNPEEIMREMQKMVLYYNQAIDITPIILDRMKGQQPRGAAGTIRPRSVRACSTLPPIESL